MEVLTVVEGRIPKAKMREFEQQYVALRDQPKPRGWKMSMILRDNIEEGLYRISTFWENRALLEEMQKNTRTPAAVALFRSHGVEPTVKIFDVLMTIRIGS